MCIFRRQRGGGGGRGGRPKEEGVKGRRGPVGLLVGWQASAKPLTSTTNAASHAGCTSCDCKTLGFHDQDQGRNGFCDS